MRRRSIFTGNPSTPWRRADQARIRAKAVSGRLRKFKSRSRNRYGLEQTARPGPAAVALLEAMLDDRTEDGLHMLRDHGASPADHRPGARRAQQSDRRPRRQPGTQARG